MIKVLEFSTEWCTPCKKYASIFDNVIKEFKDIEVNKYNAEEDFEITDKYKVQSVPTTIILDEEGKAVWRKSGLISAEDLRSVISAELNRVINKVSK